MKNIRKIRPIKKAVENGFLKQKNVTGVDIGTKIIGGKDTGEPAIIVYVAKKKMKNDLRKEEIIPEKLEGVKTDIVEMKFELHQLPDVGKYSPLVGGISLGPCRIEAAGTLGIMVKDNDSGNIMLLSNFHVMCIDGGWNVGDTMAQPAVYDVGQCPQDVAGELQRAELNENVDCAIASFKRCVMGEIMDIGEVAGSSTAHRNLLVRKRGRTTGLTYGIVDSLDLSLKIDYGHDIGKKILKNQIKINPDKKKNKIFSDHGDSGSAIVNDKNEVVGLLFAGARDFWGNTWTIANSIEKVLSALDVSVYAKNPSSKSLTAWTSLLL